MRAATVVRKWHDADLRAAVTQRVNDFAMKGTLIDTVSWPNLCEGRIPDEIVTNRRAKWANLLTRSLQATDLPTFGASPYERSIVLDFRLVVLLKCG